MPIRIFLSYAREDQSTVEDLYLQLLEAGFEPWMDTENIFAGEKWERAIIRAIKSAHFVLACLSQRSYNKRGFLQRELQIVLRQADQKLETDIYLIPIRLELCEVPVLLEDYQWVDLFKPEGWPKLLKAIQEGIECHLND